MFYLGSYYELHDESGRYSHLFWRSLHQSIYLSVCNPRMFDPARHYSFGTNRHFTEISRDEIADITEAMKAARVAFLDNGLSHRSLTTDEHDLRAVLGSVDGRRGRPLHKVRDVADAVLEAVREGSLIFVPLEDDLRDCVKAIQEDRRRRPAQHRQSQPDQFDQRQMYGKPPRLPQNLDTPSYSSGVDALSDAQPFEYQPDSIGGAATDLAARGVSEAREAECFTEYERDLDLCSALGNAMGGARGAALCRQNAFNKYQQCRGF